MSTNRKIAKQLGVGMMVWIVIAGSRVSGQAAKTDDQRYQDVVKAHTVQRYEVYDHVANAGTLDKLVQQLTEVQQQVQLEKEAGREEKERLERMLGLLAQEKKVLQTEVRAMEMDKRTTRVQRIKWLADQKKFEQALGTSQLALEQIEVSLEPWRRIVPASVLETLSPLFDKMKQQKHKGVSQRLQTIVALLEKIESFQKNIHHAQEVLTGPEGKPQEFKVLYIGLAVGYAVAVDGKKAAIGKPGIQGWEWQWRPQIAGKVQKAMDYFSHKEIAEFIQLPVVLERKVP